MNNHDFNYNLKNKILCNQLYYHQLYSLLPLFLWWEPLTNVYNCLQHVCNMSNSSYNLRRAQHVVNDAKKTLLWPGSHKISDIRLVDSMRWWSSIILKSWISMVGLAICSNKTWAWLSWRICVLQRFILCPNLPQKLFNKSFARLRNPGLWSILSGSRWIPSLCSYISIYCARSSSVLTQSGRPLASCVLFLKTY